MLFTQNYLLLCKSKNKVIVKYALHDNAQPIGISEYQLIKSLPKELSLNLPSIEQIEQELTVHKTKPKGNGGSKGGGQK